MPYTWFARTVSGLGGARGLARAFLFNRSRKPARECGDGDDILWMAEHGADELKTSYRMGNSGPYTTRRSMNS